MVGTIRAVAVEIGCLVGIVVIASLASRFAAEPPKPGTTKSGTYVLKDGTKIEASSPEEVEEVIRLHRGNIASAETRMDDLTTLRRPVVATLLAFMGVTVYVGVRNRSLLRRWLAPTWRQVAFGVAGAAGLVAVGLVAGVTLKALGCPESELLEKVWSVVREHHPILLGLVGVAAAPIAEELYFRGRLFEAFRRYLGLKAAVAFTAILFAGAHGIPILIPAYLAYGIALALLRHWSGGLCAPMMAHAINNALALFVFLD
jgi:membrane protease YdiL (CAAX protease family)